MGWDATIFGLLTLPDKTVARWLAAEVDSRQVPDAAELLSTFAVRDQTVKSTLAAIGELDDPEGLTGSAFCRRLVVTPDEVTLEKLVDRAASELPIYKETLARVEESIADLE